MTRRSSPWFAAAALILTSAAPSFSAATPAGAPPAPGMPPPPPPPSMAMRPQTPPPPKVHKVGPAGVAATVNGQRISLDEVKQKSFEQVGVQTLTQLIQMTVINQEAAKEHIIVTPAEVEAKVTETRTQVGQQMHGQTLEDVLAQHHMTLADYKDNLRTRVALQKLAAKSVKPTKMYHIRHILVFTANPSADPKIKPHTDQEAKDIIAKAQADLKAGKKFEDVAKQYSEDPQTKAQGGDLGIQGPTSPLEKPFLDAALALKPGEVTSTPAKTSYGYHLIKVDSTSDTATGAEKALYATALQQQIEMQQNQAIPALLDSLVKKAKIDNFVE